MKPICITSTRFNMKADILRQSTVDLDDVINPEDYGHWEESQDPLTGDIIRVWVPDEIIPDDPSTPEIETVYDFTDCLVRGIIEGGVRAAGTTEDWGDIYSSVELVRMWFPAKKIITKRDKVFNIRNSKNEILWKEEEMGASAGVYRATMFEVLGVTPVIDPFGNHIENYALLERSEVQAYD